MPKKTGTKADLLNTIVSDSQIMTEFLIGSWLGTGFRHAEIFGLLPYVKRQQTNILQVFSAVQIITEHLMLFEKFPDRNENVRKHFNIKNDINCFCLTLNLFLLYFVNKMNDYKHSIHHQRWKT